MSYTHADSIYKCRPSRSCYVNIRTQIHGCRVVEHEFSISVAALCTGYVQYRTCLGIAARLALDVKCFGLYLTDMCTYVHVATQTALLHLSDSKHGPGYILSTSPWARVHRIRATTRVLTIGARGRPCTKFVSASTLELQTCLTKDVQSGLEIYEPPHCLCTTLPPSGKTKPSLPSHCNS